MTDIDALLKNKHTPGPWQVSGGRNRPDIYGHMVGPDGIGIACVAYSDRTNADHVASLADARLIAAAPDLLDALTTERAKVAALEAEVERLRRIVMNWVDPFDVPDDVKQVSDELWAAEHSRQALQGDTND